MKRYPEDLEPSMEDRIEKPNKTKVKSMASEASSFKSSVDMDRQFYSNVLMHFPKDGLLPGMLKFSNVFFKHMHTGGLDERRSVRNVFMTSFGFDMELLASVVSNTQNFLLVNDSSDGMFDLKECFNGHKNMTVIFPSKSHKGYGFGAFHPKLWIVEFDDNTLRVVVGSGNLSVGDWTVWSNCLWYKDFAQMTYAKAMELNQETDDDRKMPQKTIVNSFSDYLNDFIQKLFPKGVDNLKKFGGIALGDFDFDVPIDPILLSSLPGRHYIDGSGDQKPVLDYGLERLKKIMISNPPSKKVLPTDMRIVYQTSSVGQLSSAFLIRFLGIHS
jgi:tyrosyl-DNA phosphodiesterase 1